MSKPRFANKWYQTPPVNELRQEIQAAYDAVTAVEDEKVKNAGSVPQILAGAASDTDANGNPTPSTTDFPPDNYEEGTIFKAISYSAGVDGGFMEFRLESGAWVWRWGSFRASNSNGDYQRDADKTQVCRFTDPTVQPTSIVAGNIFRSALLTYIFPAAFVGDPPEVVPGNINNSGSGALCWAATQAVTLTQITTFVLFSFVNTGSGQPQYVAVGKWAT
jgi:hypothetical protein